MFLSLMGKSLNASLIDEQSPESAVSYETIRAHWFDAHWRDSNRDYSSKYVDYWHSLIDCTNHQSSEPETRVADVPGNKPFVIAIQA